MDLTEGQLHFTFPGCTGEHFDDINATFPDGWSKIDFLVLEPSNRQLLIEVKDPSNTIIPAAYRKAMFGTPVEMEHFVQVKLVRACRDTCSALSWMDRHTPNSIFIGFLGDDVVAHDAALMSAANDRLKALLSKEMARPWSKPYVKTGVLVGFASWARFFSAYTVTRVP